MVLLFSWCSPIFILRKDTTIFLVPVLLRSWASFKSLESLWNSLCVITRMRKPEMIFWFLRKLRYWASLSLCSMQLSLVEGSILEYMNLWDSSPRASFFIRSCIFSLCLDRSSMTRFSSSSSTRLVLGLRLVEPPSVRSNDAWVLTCIVCLLGDFIEKWLLLNGLLLRLCGFYFLIAICLKRLKNSLPLLWNSIRSSKSEWMPFLRLNTGFLFLSISSSIIFYRWVYFSSLSAWWCKTYLLASA